MNPCAKNRQSIALLALNDLNGEALRELRAHLAACAGCRHYYEEISSVARKLAASAVDTNIRAPTAFHRRVVNALKVETPAREESLLSWLLLSLRNQPAAWAATGALAVLVAALVVFAPARPGPSPSPVVANYPPPQNYSADLPPTDANYQMVANRSLDKLDDLLTRQGDRNPPSAPVYTASSLALANPPD